MAEKEKRRSTTFVTSRGAIINVAAPSVYIAPGVTPVDVTNPTEMWEVLRELYGYNHLTVGNLTFKNLNNYMDAEIRQYPSLGYRPLQVNAETQWPLDTDTGIRGVSYLGQINRLSSKRSFSYGSYTFQLKVPPATDPSWSQCFIGMELMGGAAAGLICFVFTSLGGVVHTDVEFVSYPTLTEIEIVDVSNLVLDPTSSLRYYTIKLNRASAEFWTREEGLVGIIQASPIADRYTVRNVGPYILAQVGGIMPTHGPAFLEANSVNNVLYLNHSPPDFGFGVMGVVDGQPDPPRTLHPYTDDGTGTHVKWEGTAIAAGTLTSDRIPIAGYDKKTVLFLASGAGTLYVDVDYGDNSDDQYDSMVVVANTPINYVMTADPLWLRLRFTPTGYPTTVTRARVLMS